MKKNVIIIGAGPAGLAAGYELLARYRNDYQVTILEKEKAVGGLSRTIRMKECRIDIGGHRYFTKSDAVMKWWESVIPPEEMLTVNRKSEILYRGKLLDYPLRISTDMLKALGFCDTAGFCLSYMTSRKTEKVDTLEDFFVRRFGRKLYEAFFKTYTEKVWGRSPGEILPDWGYQRVNALSFRTVLLNMLGHPNSAAREKTLTDYFYYPRNGSGYLWENVADCIRDMGGNIILDEGAAGLELEEQRIQSITGQSGTKFPADYCISSMPLKELLGIINGVPEEIAAIGQELFYRGFVIVGLALENGMFEGGILQKSDGSFIGDQWIYLQEEEVEAGRIQLFDNWSVQMNSSDKTLCLGIEYFCQPGDEAWNRSDKQWISRAMTDLTNAGIIKTCCQAADAAVHREENAYPCYWGGYTRLPEVRLYLNSIENLFCIGRNGQHRYNNMDHSVETAFRAVDAIRGNCRKEELWKINTDKVYQEQNQE